MKSRENDTEELLRAVELQSPEVSAADEVDDFQAIAIPQDCVLPLIARNDFQIQLDGDPVRLAAQLRN
jgi:hypothetical protein